MKTTSSDLLMEPASLAATQEYSPLFSRTAVSKWSVDVPGGSLREMEMPASSLVEMVDVPSFIQVTEGKGLPSTEHASSSLSPT